MALGGPPCSRSQTSGAKRTTVTAMANRKKSQRGAELIRVTTGQARQAISTPMMVSLE